MDGNYFEMIRRFFEDIIKGLQSYRQSYWPGAKRFADEAEPQPWQPWPDFLRGAWQQIQEIPRWPGLRLTPEPGNRPPGPASPLPMQPPPIFTGGPYREEVEAQFQYPPTEPTAPPNAIPLTDEQYRELLRRMEAAPQKPGFTR